MYERTVITISFLAERPLMESEAEVVSAGVSSVVNAISYQGEGSGPFQQVHGPVTVDQRPVLSDE